MKRPTATPETHTNTVGSAESNQDELAPGSTRAAIPVGSAGSTRYGFVIRSEGVKVCPLINGNAFSGSNSTIRAMMRKFGDPSPEAASHPSIASKPVAQQLNATTEQLISPNTTSENASGNV
eukprot:gb/GEZN01023568.1/.p2 GENE.gb/GEZN01023568.1/~~gb/GEZN01023568.1/.p2  ORF type:complete len:122 (-),score=14.36 gb/GEZN01023568.1/:101-466(-)